MSTISLAQSSFKNHIILLKITGLYPFGSWPNLYKLYSFLLYMTFTVITPLLPFTRLVVDKETDMEVIAQNCYVSMQLVVLILKVLPFKINPDGVKKTIFDLDDEIFNDRLPEQNFITAEVVKNCNLIFWVYLINITSAGMTWSSRSLLSSGREYPFTVWLPFDDCQGTVFAMVDTFLYTGVTIGAMCNIVLDTLISCLIYHAAGQLRVLKDTLRNLSRRADQVSKDNKLMSKAERQIFKAENIYKQICKCVEHYDAIFRYVHHLEDTYSSAIFSQFLGSIVVICISCLQLSMVAPLSLSFFAVVFFTTALLSQLFLFCYAGTLLYEESNTVIDAIYMSEWYTYEKKSKTALFILMERTKRPMKVTAGKFLDLSLDTFTMIIRRSYSLLAVLKNY